MRDTTALTNSYDRVAATYTKRIADELAGKPLDRALLTAFVEQVGTLGPVCDLGCGPGHVAAFLADLGADVVGIDASAGMIAQAQQRYPNLAFQQGDMRAFAAPDATYGGIVAFYSIIHLQANELVPAFGEWRRVLRPGGYVLVAFHIGDEVVHRDNFLDHAVDLHFHFLQPDAIIAALLTAFELRANLWRAPYVEAEHPSERAYILVRKPSTNTARIHE